VEQFVINILLSLVLICRLVENWFLVSKHEKTNENNYGDIKTQPKKKFQLIFNINYIKIYSFTKKQNY